MTERHWRQGFLGEKSELIIQSSRAAIIGLCGGGSPTAQQLAHIGVGHFDLFDDDLADGGNTNRMIGLTPRAAKNNERKVDVIERMIKAINPKAKVNKHFGRWEDNHLKLRNATAVFGCVDSYLARDSIERYTRRYLVPYIDVGMDVHGSNGRHFVTGQVIMSMPGKICMRCMGFITDRKLEAEAKMYGSAGGNPQVIWPNGTLASIAVGKFMAMITPWNTDLMPSLYTEYDGNRFTVTDSKKLLTLEDHKCPHYDGENGIGDIQF